MIIRRTLTTLALTAAAGLGGWAVGQGALPSQTAPLPTVMAVAPTATCAPQAAPQPVAAAPQAAPQPVAAAQAQGGLTNLNTASQTELEALPGIGVKLAARIIAARPLASVDALSAIPHMPTATVDQLRGRVAV